MNERVDTALALSMLSYFPDLSHGGYRDLGEFLDGYFAAAPGSRPETMFSGLCPDEENGVVRAMKKLRLCSRFRALRIVYDSLGSKRYNSFCAVDDESGTAYVVIGGNYRTGFYTSGSGETSSWCDNFLGAVQTVTAEQRDILGFYDRALSCLDGERVILCGHSKGGNMAQFITVMRGSPDICFSFDGQGFSESFIRKYRRLINKRGGKIISFCPSASIVGASLTPIPTAERFTVRESPVRRGLLFSHIPAALMDGDLHLRKVRRSGSGMIPGLAGRLSVMSVRAAGVLPFVSAENGLLHIGKALQYAFKDDPERGMKELLCRDVFFLAALLLPIFPAAFLTAAADWLCGER